MCNADNNQNKNIFTFWKLINDYEIEIPLIQREYAQGRNDNAVKSIRDNLLKEIFEVLQSDNKERKDLNFIYGSKQNGKFIPIDGQQRLTTLFLLHWYVLYRNNQYGKDDWDLLKRFSYQTRTTSKNFCLNICEKTDKILFDSDIREQIEDRSWFTPNYTADPTVESMLNMLAEIHNYVIHNKITEWENIKANLLHNGKVYFLFLPLENNNANHGNAANAINVSNFEDLYMKMNARGKQLTDFEIFKAKLQDSKEIMTELCKAVRENDDATEVNDTEIINYISKYNNEFADLFYDIVGNDFDKEMFAFFKLMFATNLFSEIAKKDTSNREEKRKEYQGIKSKRGIELFNYVSAVEHKDEKLHSLKQIYTILEILSNENELIPEKDKETILKCSNANFDDDVRIFALTSFIIKFEKDFVKVKEEYEEWKRFVNNILKNSDLKNADEAYTTCTVLIKIIENVYKNNGHVLETLKDIETSPNDNSDSKYPVSYAIQPQLIEEKIKAGLMCSGKGEAWKKAIKEDAEKYFNCGYIAFLLGISNDDNGYDINKFTNYLEIIKTIVNQNYELQDKNKFALINDALLAYSLDVGDDNSWHGRQIQTTGDVFSFVFNKDSFKVNWNNETPNARFIKPWKKFCEEFVKNNEIANIENFNKNKVDTIRSALFNKEFSEITNWKEKWILLEKEFKQPTIDLRRNYIYLFNGTRNIRPSYELNTCLLYSYIKNDLGENRLKKPELVPNQDTLENGFPRRYFTFNGNGWNIAFCPTPNDNDEHWWIWKDENVIGRYSTAEIYNEIKNAILKESIDTM